MSKKFNLVQDKDDDGFLSSIKRHLGIVLLLVAVLVIAVVSLTTASMVGVARREAQARQTVVSASMTQAARPPTSTPMPHPPVARHVNVGAELRSGPGAKYPIVGYIQNGNPVTLIAHDMSGTWFKLQDGTWLHGPDIRGEWPRLDYALAD